MLPRIVLAGIAFLLCLIAAAVFFMTDSPLAKTISAVVLVAYVAFMAASDTLAAWLNERHVDAHPHLLRNDAVGEIVTVCGDFEAQSGFAQGLVLLHGERWKATCTQGASPKAGDLMIVRAREGLTLVVEPDPHSISGTII